MRVFFALFVLVLAGCQTKPTAVTSAPLPVADLAPAPDARIPAVVGHYTLGAYVDPENQLIRHEAHAIQRVEISARWDLRPTALPTRLAAVVPSSEESEPTPLAPAATVVATPAPETVVLAEIVPEPVLPPPSAVNRVVALEPAIVPNADGLVDLVAVSRACDDDDNPFAVRSVATDAIREVTLHIGGIVNGASPCVLVNGRTVQPGESIEGLTLIQVEPDSALFRHGEHRIRIPVAGKSTHVRFAL